MSAVNAKKTNKTQPALVTTGQGAALYVTLGVVLMVAGFMWLFSLMFGDDSNILLPMQQALFRLCGNFCHWFFPLLLIWTGVKLLVSTRHKVSWRDVFCLSALYWLLLAGCTLCTRYGSQPFMTYLSEDHGIPGVSSNHVNFSDYMYMASVKTAYTGGMLGMILAYPLWRLVTRIGAIVIVVFAAVALIFILFRLNPGDLFRKVSDSSEQRRERREAREAAREQAKQAEQNQQPAPIVQQMPMNELQPGQSVQRQDTVYPTPDYYRPAPVYNAQPVYPPQQAYPQSGPVQQPTPQSQGFYPVSNDLYDEKFPLNPNPGADAWNDPQQEEIAVQPQPAPIKTPAEQAEAQDEMDSILPRHLRRRRYHEQKETKEETAAASAPVSQQRPAQSASQTAIQNNVTPAAEKSKPTEERPAARTPQRPVTPAPMQQMNEQGSDDDPDDLPWDVPVRPTGKTQTARPAASHPREQSGSWADQVQRRQEELNRPQPMPAHTTAKGEPTPVYTDPVMPLEEIRGTITPRKENTASNVKLDGTSAPQVKQAAMGINVPYTAPPIRLLNEGRHVPQENMAQEDERRAQIIEGTLRSFGVDSEVKQIMHGPAITRFAIQIAPGVKVSRVSNTADNLALDLKTKHVRVEAPIQGTSYIGIEVPNQLVSTVSLREVLDSPEMHANPSPLLVALGKDIAGSPVLCDLSKMPHLLIAGATGSGKSVCINSIVCSLLYRTSPDQVRLIMIDPKQVELSVYNSIPHLLVPVVSDPRKASGALSWVVQEMLERYGKFSAQGVRNLAGFNKLNQGTDQVLPNIVVIIDEMADLMEVCRKDVEESIRRLAALARAAGIYMVLATQRPSVDVITGVIKNNIPSRIAFAVSSGTDSRTIIDINGAEKLMGKGDMLYKPAGTSPTRVQGCFVSDEEVNAVTEYIASRYQTNYDPNIAEHLDNAGKEADEDPAKGFDDGLGQSGMNGGGNEGEFKDLLQAAIEMAVEDGQTSTSMLQRRLRVGYARAGRLIDEMEKRGIISQSEGSKPRKTVITREQYYELIKDDL